MAPHVNAFAVNLSNFTGINSSRAFAGVKRIIALYENWECNAARRYCSFRNAAENLFNLSAAIGYLSAIGFKPTSIWEFFDNVASQCRTVAGYECCEATPTLRALRSQTLRAALKLEFSEMRSEYALDSVSVFCAQRGAHQYSCIDILRPVFFFYESIIIVLYEYIVKYMYVRVSAYWNNSVFIWHIRTECASQ